MPQTKFSTPHSDRVMRDLNAFLKRYNPQKGVFDYTRTELQDCIYNASSTLSDTYDFLKEAKTYFPQTTEARKTIREIYRKKALVARMADNAVARMEEK